MEIIESLSFAYRSVLDFLYKKTHRINIMTIEETLNYIVEKKCSVARYGDGEFDLILERDIGFQPANDDLMNSLKEILLNGSDNLLICLPGAWAHEKEYTRGMVDYWRRHLLRCRKKYYNMCSMKYLYGCSEMTRCYLGVKDKSKVPSLFELNRKIWDNRNVITVEGEKSRLGVGNDLFDNCKTLRRMLCPASNAYDKKDLILEKIKELANKETLILLALGPTATVLSYHLSDMGYQAVDIGNIDKEYEWFLSGATKKTVNPIKHIIEVENDQIVEDCFDEKYLSQIVYKII